MKRSSFNTNVEKMRHITNSLEQEGDTEQLRYIRDGLYHMGGGFKMTSIRGSLNKFATSVRGALESKTKTKERLENENLKSKIKEKEIETENLKSEIKEKETAYDTLKTAYDSITSQIKSMSNYRKDNEREDSQKKIREQQIEDDKKAALDSIINETNQLNKIKKIIINEKTEIEKDQNHPPLKYETFNIDILNKTLIDVFTGYPPSHKIKENDVFDKYIPMRDSRTIRYDNAYHQDPYMKYINSFYNKYYRELLWT